jgi:hypothetical protein
MSQLHCGAGRWLLQKGFTCSPLDIVRALCHLTDTNIKQFPCISLREDSLHNLSDITRITGGNRRTLQFWAEQGVLRSTRQHEGSGVPREFDDHEVVVACIVNGLSSQGVTISKLVGAANSIREYLRISIYRAMFNDAIDGRGINLLLLASYSGQNAQKWMLETSLFSDTWTDGNLESSIGLLITPDFLAFLSVNLNACLSGVPFRLAHTSVEGQKIAAVSVPWPKSG